jgi:cytochrome P450
MTDLTEGTAVADAELLALFSDLDTRANPYPSYQRIREAAPIHRSEMLPMWVVTRYQDCGTVLRDNRFGKGDGTSRIFGNPAEADDPDRQVPLLSNDSMLRKNPPDHTRLRGLVSREFTPRRVEQLRSAITEMVNQHLDHLAESGGGDVMDVLAFPLPVQVIGELLGVPESDREQFRYLVRDAAAALEPMVDSATADKARAASQAMTDYFTGLIAQRRQNPSDDLISALLEVQEEGDRLNDDELIATIILIFAAGFETTTNLIGNGLVTLLRNRDQLDLLRSRPDLAHGAVEEMLRYESSVQLDARVALEPADVDGCDIAEGDVVLTMLGAANRDPDRYENPDRFDITRTGIQHLSFAAGIHFCLGAPLARLEGEIVFNELLRRFPNIDGDTDAPWRPSLTLRGLETLDVTVS